jgi:hypothetical protein
LVFPEQPERLAAAPALSNKLHREALVGAVDPVTADSNKLNAPTQESGQRAGSRKPTHLRWSLQLFEVFRCDYKDVTDIDSHYLLRQPAALVAGIGPAGVPYS